MTYTISASNMSWVTGSTSYANISVSSNTANAIWIGPTSATTGGYVSTVTYPTLASNTINYDYYYTVASANKYDDLKKNVRPGTAWFEEGTAVRLKSALFFNRNDDSQTLTFDQGTVFLYMGVQEDLEVGKERHWFLSPTGEMVQYAYWVYDLSWRYDIKGRFEEIANEQDSRQGQQG